MDENQISPEASDLNVLCQSLRRHIQILLVMVIVVSATLTAYLVKQVRDLNRQLTFNRQVIENYAKTEGAVTDELIRQLAAYGRAHPDFNAIYMKYQLNQVTNLPPAPKK